MKIFLLVAVLISTTLSHAGPQVGYNEAQDCTWNVNGCFRGGKAIIDLRSWAAIELDKVSDCRENKACDESRYDLIKTPEKKKKYYSKSDFDQILKKRPSSEKNAQYFIPLGLSRSEMIAALATASLGLVVFANDQELMDLVQDHKTDATKKIEDFGYIMGRQGVGAIAAGSYFLGAILKNGKLKDVGLITTTAGLASQVITEFFKVGFGRSRPKNADTPYDFFGEGKSFFSGHASAVFATAAVISEVYKSKRKSVPYITYGVAALVAYARIHAEGHYTSDVLYGALAGVISAKLAYRMHKKDGSHGGLVFSPGYDPRTGTFYANFSFVKRSPEKSFSCKEFKDLHQFDLIELCLDKLFIENYENR